MTAELKKTQLIPQVIVFAPQRFQSGGAVSPAMKQQRNSVWLPLQEETTGESFFHGLLIGAATSAVVYGMGLTIDLAAQWNTVSAWMGSLIQ